MKKIAIIGRIENYEKDKPFNKRYYIDDWFRKIFDELGVLLIPVISENHLEEIANMCDGLVVTGSANDVHPKYYNEKPIEGKKYIFDEFNLCKNIVQLFAKDNKPILGICAGIQEINVIFGGTLYQQIPNHYLRDESTHNIEIKEDSFLHYVYKLDKMQVNSYHKQAVKDLAPYFKITAISNDGVIEGIEKDNVFAVQWHPEVLFDMRIFEEFVKKCI